MPGLPRSRRVRKLLAAPTDRALVQGVGDLEEDARAVARARIGAGRPAVGHARKDVERERYYLVARGTVEVRDEASPASVGSNDGS